MGLTEHGCFEYILMLGAPDMPSIDFSSFSISASLDDFGTKGSPGALSLGTGDGLVLHVVVRSLQMKLRNESTSGLDL